MTEEMDLPAALAEIRRLRDLVKKAYLEGFHEGSDGGWFSSFGDGEPWQKSDARKALKETNQ